MFVRFSLLLAVSLAFAIWKLSALSSPAAATRSVEAGAASSATLRFVLPTLKVVVEKR